MYKTKMSALDLIMDLRNKIADLRRDNDMSGMRELQQVIEFALRSAYRCHDPVAGRLLEELDDAVRDSSMSVEWKSPLTLEKGKEIEALNAASKTYCQTIVSVRFRASNRFPDRQLTCIDMVTDKTETIDLVWYGIASVKGPYADTFDLLLFTRDDNIVGFYEFTTLDEAFEYSEKTIGILRSDWTECDLSIDD